MGVHEETAEGSWECKIKIQQCGCTINENNSKTVIKLSAKSKALI